MTLSLSPFVSSFAWQQFWSERSACAALGCWHKRRWPLFLVFSNRTAFRLSDYYKWPVCQCVTHFEPCDWSTQLSLPLCDWSTQLRMFRKLCWSLPQVVLSLVQDGATGLTLQWHCTLQRRQFSPQVDNVLPAFRQCSPRI